MASQCFLKSPRKNNTFKTSVFPNFKHFLVQTNLDSCQKKCIKNLIFRAFNNNDESVLFVLLDISKAFDCINYDILCKKLENSGSRGEMLIWLKSYITGRKHSFEVM